MKLNREKIKSSILKVLPPLLINLIKTDLKLFNESIKKKQNSKKIIDIVTQKEISKDPIWIEIGSDTPRVNWITVDISGNADVCLDLSSSLPLNSNTVDKIYTSHLLEHFSYDKLIALLFEVKRILKPGGELSICVPDAKIFIDAYQINDEKLKNELNKLNHFEHPIARIDLINYIAYMGGVHKYMFEAENLKSILRFVGFKEVNEREFEPDLDLKVRKDESIYVLSTK